MRLLTALILAVLFFASASASPAHANEGRVSVRNGTVVCEGVSIWESDRYRVTGRCQGLVYPFAERLDRYMLWVVPDTGGSPVRIAEVEKGLFTGQTDQRFRSLRITAEEDNAPRAPSTTTVVEGDIARFDFAVGTATKPSVSAPQASAPTPTPTLAAAPKKITFGQNAVTNLVLIGVLAFVILWILFFMRR